MSTRASIKVKDNRNELYFYRHSDGYPEGLGELLKEFLESDLAKSHKHDLEYFAGVMFMEINRDLKGEIQPFPEVMPAIGLHGDESYQYIIDVDNLTMQTIKL